MGNTFLRQRPPLVKMETGTRAPALLPDCGSRDQAHRQGLHPGPGTVGAGDLSHPSHLWLSSPALIVTLLVGTSGLVPNSHFLYGALSHSLLPFLPGHRLHPATLGLLGSKPER